MADIRQDLEALAAELRRLEAEYNGFFAGRAPRPPVETRARVEGIIKRWDRGQIESSTDRFRFQTLQARFATFVELWDRGQRAREEGRPGPFSQLAGAGKTKAPEGPESRVLNVTAFRDPMREFDKLQLLYESLMDARRETGEQPVPFHRFAGLVKDQVAKFRKAGSQEVAFRVALKDGKVNFTARGLRGLPEE